MKNKICLLGATGSIGDSTLSVIEQHSDKLELVSIAANKSYVKVAKIVKKFNVKMVAMFDPEAGEKLKQLIDIPVFIGLDGILKLQEEQGYDTLVNGLVGSVGCLPTLKALKANKKVALANKESMVMAGPVMREYLNTYKESRILPIDSEHNAIFQCLQDRPKIEVEKLLLTASGGPFRELPIEEFPNITLERALKHPTWTMGPKITIDSSTLMNKGLEVLEAHYMFDIPFEQIEVVVHPSSIVHSMVQFVDGSLMAQMGVPDMKIPIIYSLSYPERWPLKTGRLSLPKIQSLEFYEPDFKKFPCLRLAFEAGIEGGTAPAVMNAANETAVEAFLNGNVKYINIPELVEESMNHFEISKKPELDDVLEADRLSRIYTKQQIERL